MASYNPIGYHLFLRSLQDGISTHRLVGWDSILQAYGMAIKNLNLTIKIKI
jgi:hypothetical protein